MRKRKLLTAVLLLYVVLGSWKGYLALYDGPDEEPSRIYPKKIEDFSEEDRLALEEGILIRSDAKLSQLLEAYLS